MKATPKLSYLSDIRPYKPEWWVQVKVLHTWKQHSEYGETMEIIFADKKGNKIQASCKKNYLLSLGADCRVGEWKNLENFVITPAGGGYRPTNHPYKLSFMKFTSIEPYEYNNIDMFLDLVEFETILSGQLDNNLLIDVVGQAIDIGEKLTLQCSNGKEKKKIEFTLRDINDERIPCCLWGNFADTSQLLINPPIDESAALKEMFKCDTANMSIVESNDPNNQMARHETKVIKIDTWDQYEDKTVAELLTSTQIGKCKVVCTIYAVDTDFGWYYFGCDICNTKTYKVNQRYITSGKELAFPLFWCEKCNDNVTNVTPKFKVHLLLKDDTGTTKFMLLDSIANGIIVESAEKILKGSLNEIEDPEMLPQSLRDVIGKTYKFGVIIEKNNVAYGSKSYKVAKVWSISNMLMVASQSETKSALDTTLPVDEHISLLTDGEESSETLKTPTSKRSQALKDDVPEHTSTSKRQRGKSIKMEK
ncbi:uncharacterized protein LOC117132635 [Brassica rapa]|uniref:uncharacterized protein LOC117132635 n=1 Tax=Brassica campestris TaxID=3711 RepID=UPI00142E70A3|nr:uncharacterized protein LOC117132635 [Brassica rapa]